MSKIIFGLAGSVMAVVLIGAGFAAGRMGVQPTKIVSHQGTERQEIEKIVRSYMLKNPDILLEVQAALSARDQQAQKRQQQAVVASERDDIFKSSIDGIVGNPEAAVTIVEFFDYNCSYCKHALSDMQTLVQDNPDLKFVMKEFPILGPESQQAHVVSAALRRLVPEKFEEFHLRMMSGSGRADEASAIKTALALGVDEEALRNAMADPSIMDEFAKTYELANKLSITGTPSYVIGEEVVFGAVVAPDLSQKLEAVRALK